MSDEMVIAVDLGRCRGVNRADTVETYQITVLGCFAARRTTATSAEAMRAPGFRNIARRILAIARKRSPLIAASAPWKTISNRASFFVAETNRRPKMLVGLLEDLSVIILLIADRCGKRPMDAETCESQAEPPLIFG